MIKPGSVTALERLGRERLSPSFFMRDMLHSEIANFYGVPNFPDFPDIALETGRCLANEILEPLQAEFGRISIRSAYRSVEVNRLGNEKGHNCGSNESNFAGHIWDRRDANGHMGATACIIVNRFIDYYDRTGDWGAMAWWVHDHLPYSGMQFFPKLAAFNVSWHEHPQKAIYSYIPPRKGHLTKPGMANNSGSHSDSYEAMMSERTSL